MQVGNSYDSRAVFSLSANKPQADAKGLGKAIGDARRRAGLTQQDLCARTDLSYSTLAKIERGAIKTPSVFTVMSIAQTLGISVEQLVGGGAAASSSPTAPARTYKTSKSGISFVYFDINGVLVRFFHHAFSQLAQDSGASASQIESTFWHYNDAVCRGEMTMDEFNTALSARIGGFPVDWQKYYTSTVNPIKETQECLKWASGHYRVGLLSNIMPGFIPEMIKIGLLPHLDYNTIIDSSEVGAIKPEPRIYQLAAQKAGTDNPSQILLIDDSRTNLMAAERLGWQVMWFDDYQPAESVERIKSALEF